MCKLLCRTDRYCKKTTAVNGVIIPEGAAIIISIYVLHHSPLYWKDPEKFDPDRYVLLLGHCVCLAVFMQSASGSCNDIYIAQVLYIIILLQLSLMSQAHADCVNFCAHSILYSYTGYVLHAW